MAHAWWFNGHEGFQGLFDQKLQESAWWLQIDRIAASSESEKMKSIYIQQVIEGHLLYLHPHPKKMHTFGSRQNISSPAMEDRKLQGIHMCTCAAMAMERLKHLWHCWTRVLPSNSKTVTQDTLSQHNPLQKVALQTQREFDHPSNSYIHLTYFVICVVLTVCLQKGLFWKGPHLVVYYVCAPTVRRRFPNLHQDCLPPKHIVSIAPTRCLFT